MKVGALLTNWLWHGVRAWQVHSQQGGLLRLREYWPFVTRTKNYRQQKLKLFLSCKQVMINAWRKTRYSTLVCILVPKAPIWLNPISLQKFQSPQKSHKFSKSWNRLRSVSAISFQGNTGCLSKFLPKHNKQLGESFMVQSPSLTLIDWLSMKLATYFLPQTWF